MGKRNVLYAHATVELTDLVPGTPYASPRRDDAGRPVLRLFRRGDEVPVELFAEYVPSESMPVCHADLDHLLEHGAVAWEAPEAVDLTPPYYVLRLPDGQEIQVAGEPPDPDAIQVVSGETISQATGATVKEAG